MLIAATLLWSLTPCLALWVGLYVLKSAVWTFVLYHGLCLLPAIILRRALWRDSFIAPKWQHCALLFVAAVIFSLITLAGYELLGHKVLSNQSVVELLQRLGYCKLWLLPLSLYVVIVNPIIEEIYWRGVIFNEFDQIKGGIKHFGIIWSSFAYALFHFLIVRMVVSPGYAEFGTLMLALYGAFLAIIYRKTGSIVTTGIAHGLLTDMAAVVLIIDLVRRYPVLL